MFEYSHLISEYSEQSVLSNGSIDTLIGGTSHNISLHFVIYDIEFQELLIIIQYNCCWFLFCYMK